MGSDRRIFSERQRAELFEAQGGLCGFCGEDLGLDAQAHHVVTYAEGGETDVHNGVLVCPPCHRLFRRRSPRWFQMQGALGFLTSPHRGDLIEAPTGSGKTGLGVYLAEHHLRKNADENPLVVVLTPSRLLVKSWAETLAKALPDFAVGASSLRAKERAGKFTKASHPVNGISVWVGTYQSLSRNSGILHQMCAKRNVLVFLDELHRVVVREHEAWGNYAEYAFEDAFRICGFTATRVRADALPLACLREVQDQEGNTIPVFSYAPKKAIEDEVISPLEFHSQDSFGEWEKIYYDPDGQELGPIADSGWISDPKKANSALRTALTFLPDELDERWEDHFLLQAVSVCLRLLDEARIVFLKCGCLIFVNKKGEAALLAKVIHRFFPEIKVLTATGDDDDAHHRIDRFRGGEGDVLIACDMISEGVDLPRVKIIGYLASERQEGLLRQRFGRGTRLVSIDGKDRPYPCQVVIPSHPEIKQVVKDIYEAQQWKVKKPGPGGEFTPIDFLAGENSGAISDGFIQPVADLIVDFGRDVDQAAKRLGLSARKTVQVLNDLRITPEEVLSRIPENVEPLVRQPESREGNLSRRLAEMDDEHTYLRRWAHARWRDGELSIDPTHLYQNVRKRTGTVGLSWEEMTPEKKDLFLQEYRAECISHGYRGRRRAS